MVKALCRRCKGSAEGSTFEEASSKINHAVGLGRSIPCGASYDCVIDDSPKPAKTIPTPEPKKTTKIKDKTPKKTFSVKDDIPKDIVEEKSQAVNE
ncbi:MAG: hypothetical protein V3U87_15630 [Methylococcaceae bacterium]